MAKTPKLRSNVVSAKSRAARRASSPSIDLDKSLNAKTPPANTESNPSVLAARSGAGISKKNSRKPLSRHQRLRKEKGFARADIVLDKLEKKVSKSKEKVKVIKDRSADWEDIDTTRSKRKRSKKNALSQTPADTGEVMEDIVNDGAVTLPLQDSTELQSRQQTHPANTGGFDLLEDIT